jgi:hypothetical protein
LLSRLRTRLTYANVVSTLCLFIVLGGGAYAATTITGKNVKNSSLTGTDVKNSSLTGVDVKNGSLLAADFGDGQLPAGPPGPKGDNGAPGAKGDKGDEGNRGPAGFENVFIANAAVSYPVATAGQPTAQTRTASCPAPTPQVVGGGYSIPEDYQAYATVLESRPEGTTGTGWSVRIRNGGNSLSIPVTIYAVCVE